MKETLLNVALAIAILGGSALITYLFARAMYLICPQCRTLNARRRTHCRRCGQALRAETPVHSLRIIDPRQASAVASRQSVPWSAPREAENVS